MSKKLSVKPGEITRSASTAAIVVAAGFLVFGLVLVTVGFRESANEPALRLLLLLFGVIWAAACIGIIVFNARLLNRKEAPDRNRCSRSKQGETAGQEKARAILIRASASSRAFGRKGLSRKTSIDANAARSWGRSGSSPRGRSNCCHDRTGGDARHGRDHVSQERPLDVRGIPSGRAGR